MRIVEVKTVLNEESDVTRLVTLELEHYEVQELINEAAERIGSGVSIGYAKILIERHAELTKSLHVKCPFVGEEKR